MSKKHELTVASLLYMVLVIFIHLASECVTGYRTDSVPFAVMNSAHRLSSFVVQGFLFLSGVKLFLPRGNDAFSYGRFYLSRTKRVVLPYLFVFAGSCVFFVATKRLPLDLPYFLYECATGGLIGHFYYVAIMCQFYLLIPLWRFAAARCSAILTCLTSLFLMLICRVHLPEIVRLLTGLELTLNSRLFTTFLFYFVAGIYCGKHYDRFTEFLTTRRREITALFAVTGGIDCVLIWVIRNGLYYPAWADDFHVLYSVAAILFTLSAALAFVRHFPEFAERPLVRRLSEASYNVYLIHPLFIFVTDSLLDRAGMESLTGRFLLRAVLVYPAALGLCVLWEVVKRQLKRRKSA